MSYAGLATGPLVSPTAFVLWMAPMIGFAIKNDPARHTDSATAA